MNELSGRAHLNFVPASMSLAMFAPPRRARVRLRCLVELEGDGSRDPFHRLSTRFCLFRLIWRCRARLSADGRHGSLLHARSLSEREMLCCATFPSVGFCAYTVGLSLASRLSRSLSVELPCTLLTDRCLATSLGVGVVEIWNASSHTDDGC